MSKDRTQQPIPSAPEHGGGGGGGEHGHPHRRSRMGFVARLRTYFFAGVLVTAPVAITFYLAWLFVTFVDNKVTPLIPAKYNPENYLPFGIPGLGLIIVIVGLTLIGALAAGFVGRTLVRIGESIVARMPVIRSVYGATKQVFETVLAQKSSAFRQVVLFEYPRRGCWAMGFITGVTKGEVQEQTMDEVVNVFLPTTPNPTSGYLLFVPRKELIILTMTVEEGIKMVVSGGIVTPPDQRPEHLRRVKHVGPASGDEKTIPYSPEKTERPEKTKKKVPAGGNR